MAAKLVLPRVHALVVCDDVVPSTTEEEAFDLRNVRTRIVAPAFPYAHPLLAVYLQLTGHEGIAAARLRIVSVKDEADEVSSSEQQVDFSGPLTVVHSVFWFEDCIFPEPGLDYVQVLFENKLLLERPLLLTPTPGGTTNGRQ
jgi:hypothetical protein